MSAKPDRQTLLPLISSAAASPVKTSATRGRVPDFKGNGAGFGSSMPESFANYDRASLSWRTSQRCLLGEWETYSESWPNSGMMRSGVVYGPVMLGLRIDESGCSLSGGGGVGLEWWPTPSVVQPEAMRSPREWQTKRPACDDNLAQSVSRFAPALENPWPRESAMDGASVSLTRTADGWKAESERHAAMGQHKQYPLQVAVALNASEGQARQALWPTPVASVATGVVNATKVNRDPNYHAGTTLTDAIRLWPTPDAQMAKHAAPTDYEMTRPPEIKAQLHVAVALETWPTPMATDGKLMGGPASWQASETLAAKTLARAKGEAAALSAAWVETLMGFPPGWTDIQPGWKPTRSPRTGPRALGKPSTPGNPRAPRAKKKTAPPA